MLVFFLGACVCARASAHCYQPLETVLPYISLEIDPCTMKGHKCDVNALCTSNKECICKDGFRGDGITCMGTYKIFWAINVSVFWLCLVSSTLWVSYFGCSVLFDLWLVFCSVPRVLLLSFVWRSWLVSRISCLVLRLVSCLMFSRFLTGVSRMVCVLFLMCYIFKWVLSLIKYNLFRFTLDIDECTTNTHNCDVKARCSNTEGSYKCTCKDGYGKKGGLCIGNNNTFFVDRFGDLIY